MCRRLSLKCGILGIYKYYKELSVSIIIGHKAKFTPCLVITAGKVGFTQCRLINFSAVSICEDSESKN